MRNLFKSRARAQVWLSIVVLCLSIVPASIPTVSALESWEIEACPMSRDAGDYIFNDIFAKWVQANDGTFEAELRKCVYASNGSLTGTSYYAYLKWPPEGGRFTPDAETFWLEGSVDTGDPTDTGDDTTELKAYYTAETGKSQLDLKINAGPSETSQMIKAVDPDNIFQAAIDSYRDLSGGGVPDDETVNCGGFALAWLVCGGVNALATFGDFIIKNLIVPFLQSTPIDLENGESSLFKVWSTFRIIANIILVAALLFVVFGNAIGSGPAEAYLAKRSLPRIFIAAILINTSIYIAAAMVDITNILGKGIGQLLMAPFAGNGAFVFDIGAGATTVAVGAFLGTVATAIIFAPLAGAVMPFLAIFIFLPAVIAMLAMFFTLVIRQGIIMFLVIASPVAFALFALPNTAKYFSKWWDLFIKTLMVYPIVMVLIAMSNILAVMVDVANPDQAGTQLIKNLVSIFLMLVPVFLTPFAFKLAGGFTGQMYGAISGMGKKGLEAFKGDARDPNSRQSQYRSRASDAGVRARSNTIERLNKPAAGDQPGWRRYPAKAAIGVLSMGNLAQRRAAINQQVGQQIAEMDLGHSADVDAFWGQQIDDDMTMIDANGKEHKLLKNNWYGIHKDKDGHWVANRADGVPEAYSQAQHDRIHELAAGSPSALRQLANTMYSRSGMTDSALEAHNQTLIDQMNKHNYEPALAADTFKSIAADNKGAHFSQRYRTVTGTKGNLRFSGYNHANLSNEAVDAFTTNQMSNSTADDANIMLAGYQEIDNKENKTAVDLKTMENYELLAQKVGENQMLGSPIGAADTNAAWSNFANTVSKRRQARAQSNNGGTP